MRIAIAGGGTAGHVTPALALGQALTQLGHDTLFLGTRGGIESRLVPAAGFQLTDLPVTGFDRARPWSLISAGVRAGAAAGSVRRFVRQREVAAVVGMGGYVSAAAAWGAWLARVPLVLHEQNIVLGLAHRVSRPVAAAVAVSFEETLASAGPRAVHTGNPVSPAIARFDRAVARANGLERWGLDPARKTILVFGGSLGALTLNRGAAELGRSWKGRGDVQILHIAGSRHASGGSGGAGGNGDGVYKAIAWAERMEEAYGVADVALCRGGATTVAELCATGTPSIIVPYPHHRDRQQELHARVMEQAGAAVVLHDRDVGAETLAMRLETLLSSPEELERMAQAGLARARPRAAADLAEVVIASGQR